MSASNPNASRKHLLFLLVLIAGTVGMVAGIETRITRTAGVRELLPDQLGDDWTGSGVLFCQRPTCGRSWLTKDVEPDEKGIRTCSTNWQGDPCGGELLKMALGEKLMLPEDTVILKKQYTHTEDPSRKVFSSIVFSGEQRSSIHRPEMCMTGQGHTIEKTEVIQVDLPGREPLEVMVLHLAKKVGPNRLHYSYYAYWFVGKDRETPLHHERMIWMALDRVLKNVSHRWAYIAVSGKRFMDLEDTTHYDEIREVVGKLYPQISLVAPDA